MGGCKEFRMTREDNVFYAKRNLVDSIWKEANIEGIAATFPQTKEIFEGRAVSGLTVDETVAINNLKHAWAFVLDNLDAGIDISYIRRINYLVGLGITSHPGEFRLVDVNIGGTTWKPEFPEYELVKDKLNEVLAQPPSLRRVMEMFATICRMQLFIDGNKRTAQLVANAMMIGEGRGVFSIPVGEKPRWEELIIGYYETGEPRELGELVDFLISTSISGFDSDEYHKPGNPRRCEMPEVNPPVNGSRSVKDDGIRAAHS